MLWKISVDFRFVATFFLALKKKKFVDVVERRNRFVFNKKCFKNDRVLSIIVIINIIFFSFNSRVR